MIRPFRKIARWFGKEDGSATIEFCIWFPFFISLLGSAFEASLITTRQVMLTGALDRTVRDLQLGNLGSPDHAELKVILCDLARFIPNCTSSLHIEMERISTDTFAIRSGQVQCVDLDDDSEPTIKFDTSGPNELMLITVCAAIRPMVPITGLGLKLPKINGGTAYALPVFSAYVVEPA